MLVTDSAHAPIALLRMSGDVTTDDVAKMRVFYQGWHARKQRFATIVDSRTVSPPGSAIRRALSELTNDFEELRKLNTVAVAVVLDSKILIGALTAIRWFINDKQGELRYFPTAQEALEWLEPLLAREGLGVDPTARDAVTALDAAPLGLRA
jgi:hypothetical protein